MKLPRRTIPNCARVGLLQPSNKWSNSMIYSSKFQIPALHSPRSIDKLKKEIQNIDAEYDGCQDVWSKGEANGFFTETLLGLFLGMIFKTQIDLY